MTLPAKRIDILDQVETTASTYTGSWISTAGVERATARAKADSGGSPTAVYIDESADAQNVLKSWEVPAEQEVTLGSNFVRLRVDFASSVAFHATLRALEGR